MKISAVSTMPRSAFVEDSHKSQLDYTVALQRAFYPKEAHFDALFDDYFLLFRPTEMVSGHFFWLNEQDGVKYFAMAECSGNGVSSAMLAIFGFSLLNNAIGKQGIRVPSEIMQYINQALISSPDLYFSEGEVNDWIDISLAAYYEDKQELYYCGANKKALIISENRTHLLPANSQPVGGWDIRPAREFKMSRLKVDRGEWVYFGCDSYRDQLEHFGAGDEKHGSLNLYKMLESISSEAGKDQKQFLTENLNVWMEENEQVEDVFLMGIKL